MTRKRYRKLVIAMLTKMYANLDKKLTGEQLKFYRDNRIPHIKCDSYREAWELMKPIRDMVGM